MNKMPVKNVIFSVGPAHPLYNKPVAAYIESENCGYDKRQVYAKTVEPVDYPEDPEGILVYDENWNFSHYETKPAWSEVWSGYCKICK